MHSNRVKRVNIINPCKKPVIKNSETQYRGFSIPLHHNNNLLPADNQKVSFLTPRNEVCYIQSRSQISKTKENISTGRQSYKNTNQTLLTEHSYDRNSNVSELRVLFNDIFGFTKQLHRSQKRQKQIIQRYEKDRSSFDSSEENLLYSQIRHSKRLSWMSCQQSRPYLQASCTKKRNNTPENEWQQRSNNQTESVSYLSNASQTSNPIQLQIKNTAQGQCNELIMISQTVEYQYSERSDQQLPPNNNVQQSLTSSYSLQQLENQEERKLFWQLLQSKNMNWLSIFPKMKSIQVGQIRNFVKIGENQHQINENQTISLYVSMWLATMGYEDPENKSRILKTVSFSFPDNIMATSVAQKLYDSLFHGFLPCELQLNALMHICQKGWQYFSFLICKLIRLLTRNKNHGSQQFYKKMSQAINE